MHENLLTAIKLGTSWRPCTLRFAREVSRLWTVDRPVGDWFDLILTWEREHSEVRRSGVYPATVDRLATLPDD